MLFLLKTIKIPQNLDKEKQSNIVSKASFS